MKYISTRGQTAPKSFSEVLLMGLAPDGGLMLPERYPQVDAATLKRWRGLSYAELAFEIMSLFIDDIPAADLRRLVGNTYTEAVFGTREITPVRTLSDGIKIQALSNGPTLAFKDMAMQFLGHAFEYVLAREGKCLNIIGATSGDTGSAAEYAMRGKARINVFMLSPHGRMSPFQQAQMYSLQDANIHNIAIEGVFDDCQDLVKAVNADAAYKSHYHIGAVNSINWARVLAQSVYYIKAYLALDLPEGAEVDYTVPSGNFGNIYAGYIAKRMGLPIAHLIVATNENDVLYHTLRSGEYRARPAQDVAKTSSPSMDIGKASNFERYIYNISGDDSAQTAALWHTLESGGTVSLQALGERIRASGFDAGRSSHADRLATIRDVNEKYGRLIDPHTADGVHVARQWRAAHPSDRPMICLETALPAKFEETVQEATGITAPRPERFRDIEQAPRRVEILPNDVTALKDYIARSLAQHK